jgi:hypothetical protein
MKKNDNDFVIVVKPQMKPIIKKIQFSKEQLDEIDKINKGEAVPKTKLVTTKNGYAYEFTTKRKFSFSVGRKRLTELYGGVCTACGKYPDYKVTYDVGDKNQPAKLIQRYCQMCFSKWEDRLWKN